MDKLNTSLIHFSGKIQNVCFKSYGCHINQVSILKNIQKILIRIFSSNTDRKEHFFFEAGAFDGELLSNSLLFETKLGWSGVLVEPNPVAFGMLLSKHRKAWSINTCLSRKPFPEVISFDMDGLTGGIITENDVRPSWFQVRIN